MSPPGRARRVRSMIVSKPGTRGSSTCPRRVSRSWPTPAREWWTSRSPGDPFRCRHRNAALRRTGSVPSRALGQNFVADPNTVRRIARLADVGPGSSVLEFGAGLGSLSLALAETGAAGGGGRVGPPSAPRPAHRGRTGRGRGGRRGCHDPRCGRPPGRAGRGPVVVGGQPALQPGHPPGAQDPGRGAGDRPAARHGAA